MEITALLTGNRRGVNTSSPKALLINIEGFNRKHCWVDITKQLAKLQPAGHQRPIKVRITAKVKEYLKRGVEPQQTIIVEDIQRI